MQRFDPAVLFAHPVPEIAQQLTRRDTILYALSVGAGDDPLGPLALDHCLEDRLHALPTQAVVMGYPGFWLKDPATGVDWRQVLHGEQRLRILAPLPVEGVVRGVTRLTGLVDKGRAGAALYSRRSIVGPGGAPVAEVSQTTILRGHGGFAQAFGAADAPLPPLPDRAPDLTCTVATRPDAALLYRLNGDFNPLHADPEVARSVGFDRPILHGLCTFGIAGVVLMREFETGGAGLRALAARFSAPVFPGETLSF
jgi:acyl dehydratase